MLVLLIIMMLIAPMLQQGVAVTLPEAVNTRRQARHAGPDGHRDRRRQQVLRERDPGREGRSRPTRPAALEDKKEKIVYLKGDKDAKYSAIMDAMDALRKARIENIALITERKLRPGESAGGQ